MLTLNMGPGAQESDYIRAYDRFKNKFLSPTSSPLAPITPHTRGSPQPASAGLWSKGRDDDSASQNGAGKGTNDRTGGRDTKGGSDGPGRVIDERQGRGAEDDSGQNRGAVGADAGVRAGEAAAAARDKQACAQLTASTKDPKSLEAVGGGDLGGTGAAREEEVIVCIRKAGCRCPDCCSSQLQMGKLVAQASMVKEQQQKMMQRQVNAGQERGQPRRRRPTVTHQHAAHDSLAALSEAHKNSPDECLRKVGCSCPRCRDVG